MQCNRHQNSNNSNVLIFIWKHKNPRRVKTIQNNKVNRRGIATLDFMLSDKATVITAA